MENTNRIVKFTVGKATAKTKKNSTSPSPNTSLKNGLLILIVA
ncbi:hypothetical protein ACWGOQ_0007585 [Aquimarina sp. M1]